jgi:hypothetical protein
MCALVAMCAQAGESKTTLGVYGHLPSIEDMAMSPDGTKFAYVRTQWLDDDNLLIMKSNTGGPPAGYVSRSR